MTVQLYLGDCLTVMKGIESGSVDAIITDPPYHKKYMHLWGALAQEAERLLVDGGLLMTLCGHHSIDQILSDMTKHLTFYWIGGMPNSLGRVGRYHPRQMMCGWKPCLWLSKGKVPKHPYAFDFIASKLDKEHHEWGQPLGWFEYYVNKLTKEGWTILDPFMGSGTTGVACVQTGRNFIGIEIDEEYFRIAEKRIANTQPRLI